jgi:hypothetical protein
LVDTKSHASKISKVTMSKLLGGVISELVLILLNLDFEIDRSWMKIERFLNDIHIPTRAKCFSHSNSYLYWALLRDVSSWVLKKNQKWFSTHIICYPHPEILACIPPLRNMHPPPIYPQLPHLRNHGFAILACITSFWSMCPPPIYPQSWPWHPQSWPWHSMSGHLKRKFLKKWSFSWNIIKTPKSSRDKA